MDDVKTIKMTRSEFFTRLSYGNITAWNYDIEPDECCVDGKIHCFGNDDVYIAMSLGEDDIECFSYWTDGGAWIELFDLINNN